MKSKDGLRHVLSKYSYIKDIAIAIHTDLELHSVKFYEKPTIENFETLLKTISLDKYADEKIARLLLYSLLDKKISDLPNDVDNIDEMRENLQNTLITNLHIQLLPKSYQNIYHAMNMLHESIGPIFNAGRDSQAKKNDDLKKERSEDFAKKIIGTPQGKNLEDINTYKEFLKKIYQGSELDQGDFNKLKDELHDTSKSPILQERNQVIMRDAIKNIKKTIAFVSSNKWFRENISKEERQQIPLLFKLVEKKDTLNQQEIDEIFQEINYIHTQELKRADRQVSAILKKIVITGGTDPEDFSRLTKAIIYPFEKIAKNSNLSSTDKTALIISKLCYKSMQMTAAGVGSAVESSFVSAKMMAIMPFEMLNKLGLSSINFLEVLKLYNQLALTSNPDDKAKVLEKIQQETKNLTYNSRKMLEALLISAALSITASALVTTLGTAAPVVLMGTNDSLAALISAHALEMLHLIDYIKYPVEFMNLLLDNVVESDADITERELLARYIRNIIEEIMNMPMEKIERKKSFIESFNDLEEDDTVAERDLAENRPISKIAGDSKVPEDSTSVTEIKQQSPTVKPDMKNIITKRRDDDRLNKEVASKSGPRGTRI